jgi:hypothetical protein
MKPKLFLAALIGLASAITVATQVYAMSSSVADYPEFTSCPLAKGTWWGSGKEAEKYTAGHNMLFVVKESRLLSAEDRSRGSMSEPKRGAVRPARLRRDPDQGAQGYVVQSSQDRRQIHRHHG